MEAQKKNSKGAGTAGTIYDKRLQSPGRVENLIPTMWKPGQSGNPEKKNLKKKHLKYLRELGHTKVEIENIIAGMVAMNPKELETFIARPGATVLELTVGNAILKGMARGSLYAIDSILDRIHGKARETVDANIKAIQYNITIDIT
jgi:hypothetical protein